MLKTLLGNWRENRKKPTLLPEDIEVQFEDPSRINPLFEDSDASIASSQRHEEHLPTFDLERTSEQEYKSVSETALVDVASTNRLPDDSAKPPKNAHTSDGVPEGGNDFMSKDNMVEDLSNSSKQSEDKADLNLNGFDGINGSKNMPTKLIPNNSRVYQIMAASKKRLQSQVPVTKLLSESAPSGTKSDASQTVNDVLLSIETTEETVKDTTQVEEKSMSESSKRSERTDEVYSLPSTSAMTDQIPNDHIATNDKKYISSTTKNSTHQLEKNYVTANEKNDIPSIYTNTITPDKNNGVTENESDNIPNPAQLKLPEDKNESTLACKVKSETNRNVTKNQILSDLLEKKVKTIKSVENNISSTTGNQKNPSMKIISKHEASNENVISESNIKRTRTRAIEELIKKFQGQTNEHEGPSKNFKEKSEFPSSQSSRPEVVLKNSFRESEQDKESIANIFKFPPPPPLHSLKIESRDTIETVVQNVVPQQLNSTTSAEQGKTRSDSSLSRNKTVASQDTETEKKIFSTNDPEAERKIETFKTMETGGAKPKEQNRTTSTHLSETVFNASNFKRDETILKFIPEFSKESNSVKNQNKTKPENRDEPKSDNSSTKSSSSEETKVKADNSTSTPNQKAEKQSSGYQKQSQKFPKSSRSTESKTEQTAPKSIADPSRETEAVKSHSEDSGITRGDQISSEAPAETTNPDLPKEEDKVPPSVRRNSKEKKTTHHRGKSCKRCKKLKDEGVPLKMGQCDDYYDSLTGFRRMSKAKYSDSLASELSWDEKELIRKLRSRRGTVRSHAPSTKSRRSSYMNSEMGRFKRSQHIRRSLSDDSMFNSSTACSCDACWMLYVKQYAHGRASLRGFPNEGLCTCRATHQDLLARRVQFRPETIPEITASIPEEANSKEKEDLCSGQTSSSSKDNKSTTSKLDKKFQNTSFRLVTPWELEEWDVAMRKHLLQKKRKRARYMVFMALVMVTFVGLVVALLMVYLRRKVL